MKKKIILILMFLIILSACADLSEDNDYNTKTQEEITAPLSSWTNAKFEKAVRNFLDKPEGDIYTNELDKIEKIVINKEGVSINGFDNLSEDNCYVINFTDFQDFDNFNNLEHLSIVFRSDAVVEKLATITSHDKLEYLEIIQGNIKDISNIANYTNLQTLKLSKNPIDDFTPLINLHTIKNMELELLGFKKDSLTERDMANLDLQIFKNLSTLEYLKLNTCNLTNIDAINYCESIKKLELYNCCSKKDEIYEIASNEDCTLKSILINLVDENRKPTIMIDVSRFKNFNNIRSLYIIDKFKNINNLKSLENLSLSHGIIDASLGLAELDNLINLEIKHCRLLNTKNIEKLNQLRIASIINCGTGKEYDLDYSFLKNNSNMTQLRLCYGYIEGKVEGYPDLNLEDLACFKKLQFLVLDHTFFYNPYVLKSFKHLKEFNRKSSRCY